MPQNKQFKEAIHALRNGDPVLLYDGDDREAEVDMVYAAEHIDADAVARLRNDAGGLICTAIAYNPAERLGLPYYRDAIDHPAVEDTEREYGDRSSFSLWVNHTDTYTGITDNDRATTIQHLTDAAADDNYTADDFAADFTTPGHVAVLRAADELLGERQGHTEMGVYLVQKAQCAPVAVVCEMLDSDTGEALSREDAEEYAEDRGLVFLAGEEVRQDWADTVRKIKR